MSIKKWPILDSKTWDLRTQRGQQQMDNHLNQAVNQWNQSLQKPLLQEPLRDPRLLDIEAISNMEDHMMISYYKEQRKYLEVHRDEHGILEMWKSEDVADRKLAVSWISTYIGVALSWEPGPLTSYEFITLDYGLKSNTNTVRIANGTTSGDTFQGSTTTGNTNQI